MVDTRLMVWHDLLCRPLSKWVLANPPLQWVDMNGSELNCTTDRHVHLHPFQAHMSGRKIWINFEAPTIYTSNQSLEKMQKLMQFLEYLAEPFLRSLRSVRSNNLETQNDKNYKWGLFKSRWNPKFDLSNLENDFLTSLTSKGAQWFFSKITFLKSVHQAETTLVS